MPMPNDLIPTREDLAAAMPLIQAIAMERHGNTPKATQYAMNLATEAAATIVGGTIAIAINEAKEPDSVPILLKAVNEYQGIFEQLLQKVLSRMLKMESGAKVDG